MKPGWRLAGLGLGFMLLFGGLTLRLWSLQIAEGQVFEETAASQQIRVVSTPAPRGEIVDSKLRVLAGTRVALGVIVDRQLLPEERLDEVVGRLAALLELSTAEVRELIDSAPPGGRAVVAPEATTADALFIVEHAEDFPGIFVEDQPLRVYPAGDDAAHVVGYIGRPDESDLAVAGIDPTDVVGKFGVEGTYDQWLRGTAGFIKYRVGAAGDVLALLGVQPPAPGGTTVLTLDLDVQQVLEESLRQGMVLAKSEGEQATRAAGVVLDVTDGSVVAMASVPSFEPQAFVGGLTQNEWDALSDLGAFNNFVIQGIYPPGSTFKVVAYAMAMEEGIYPQELARHDDAYFCTGRIEFQFNDGSQQVYHDWLAGGHGDVDLHGALQASCDDYFWEVALRVWRGEFDEDLIQQWARQLGFDAVTGVDLPFEQRGLIPDRDWFERTQHETPGRVREGPWVGGDVMNVVIGQGEVVVTPLQLANAYAALANGGTLWQPHVVDRVIDQNGNVLFINEPQVIRELTLDPATVALFRQDLKLVVNGRSGTARSAFKGFGESRDEVGGKTGTAEIVKGATRAEDIDTALFVGVVPVDNPKYVVAVVIERGGSGGRIAAPTARRVLQYLMGEDLTDVAPGADTD